MTIALRDDVLAEVGFAREDLDLLAGIEPKFTSVENFEGDAVAASRFFEAGQALLDRLPGLVPSRAQVLADRERKQKDKEGYEVDQGLFLSAVLSHPPSGAHLVHAMLRPRPESAGYMAELQRTGRLDIGATTIERRG